MAAPYRVRDETAPAIINTPIRIAILTGSFDAPTTSRYAIPHRTTIPEIQRMSIIAAELIAANISKVAFVARAVPRPAAANAFVNGVGRRRQLPDAIRVRQRIRMIGPTDSVAQITLCRSEGRAVGKKWLRSGKS